MQFFCRFTDYLHEHFTRVYPFCKRGICFLQLEAAGWWAGGVVGGWGRHQNEPGETQGVGVTQNNPRLAGFLE